MATDQKTERVVYFMDKNKIETESCEERQRGTDIRNFSLPYLTDNFIISTVRSVRLSEKSFHSVLLMIDRKYNDKDIVTAIALKHFFQENGIPCSIHVDPDKMRRGCHISDAFKEVTTEIPPKNSFVAISIGAAKERDLLDSAKNLTYLFFSVAGGRFAYDGIGVKGVADRDANSSVEPLYSLLKNAEEKEGLSFSVRVKTELLVALLYAIGNARSISRHTLGIFKALIDDGANFDSADETFNALPSESLRFINVLTEKLQIKDRIASCIISRGDIPVPDSDDEEKMTQFHEMCERSIRALRFLNGADAWIVYVEQDDGEYYTILQTRKVTSYKMDEVAKKNNGNGSAIMARALIYEMDISKIYRNLKDHMRSVDSAKIPEEIEEEA